MDAIPNSLKARDIAYHLHPVTSLVEQRENGPLIIKEGRGIFLVDETGREYLDGCAGLWSVSLGYSQKRLVDAAARQMAILPYSHSFRNTTHDVAIELASKIISMLPVKMSKVFFGCSGSDANDTITKMVWYYNNALGRFRKKKFIGLMGGYHGLTIGAASLTGLPRNHFDFDVPLSHVRHADCPHFYRYGRAGETEDQFTTRLAENLEALILREVPDTVAAFIAEPVLGSGGVLIPPHSYFEKIQPILKKYDILFVADEVICGFGRTGNMFGSETFNLQPDIMTLAKGLSSSYQPISAVAISEPIYDVFVKQSEKLGMFAHGFTYSAHPVCAAVALETLNIYEDQHILDHVRKVSPRFIAGLRKLEQHPLVGEVRGIGLMAGIEIVADKATRRSYETKKHAAAQVAENAQNLGLIVRPIGETLCFSPPLIITEKEIDILLERFGKALDQAIPQLRG